jgi:hypothetical protein
MRFSRIRSIFGVCLLAFGLLGCPTETKYPLIPQTQADKASPELIGTWMTNSTSAEVQQVRISTGKQAKTYRVEVQKKGSNYDIEATTFTGWLGTFANKQYLILQEDNDSYYLYYISLKGNTMITFNVRYKEEGDAEFASTEDFQQKFQVAVDKPAPLYSRIEWMREQPAGSWK